MGSTTIHNTFVLERYYPKSPEVVFAAFSDLGKRRRWYAEGAGHDVEEFESDFRVGGADRLIYRFKDGTPFPGVVVLNKGFFLDIIPDRRVVTASTMTLGDRRISATLVTVELVPAADGTTLVCTHQGAYFEGADGPEIREMGWRKLFDRLVSVLN